MKYKCNKCNYSGDFEVYENVYSKAIVPKPHFEIVCKNCSYGIIVFNEEVAKCKINI